MLVLCAVLSGTPTGKAALTRNRWAYQRIYRDVWAWFVRDLPTSWSMGKKPCPCALWDLLVPPCFIVRLMVAIDFPDGC